MLKATRQVRSSAELREVLGVQRLAAGSIAVQGGEWRREGARWRFYSSETSRERRAPSQAPAAPQWWNKDD